MKQKLTLSDFANLLSQREGVGRREAELFVRAFFDLIENGLEQDKLVKIKGLGTFKLVNVSERESVNINTGERFQISGHTKVTFTPDNSMKELVNRPFAHFEAIELNEETDTSEFDEIDEEMREAEEAEDNAEAEETQDEGEAAPTEEETSPTEEDTTPAPMEENDEPEEVPDVQVTAPEPLLTSGTPTEQEEPLPLTQPTPSEQSKPTADEDIVVTSPTPISAQAEQATEPEQPTAAETMEQRTSTAGNTSNTGGGYVYQPVPLPKKRNVWKAVAFALATIILMALSYFAGYYRMLCPTCHEEEVIMDTLEAQPLPATTPDTAASATTEEKADTAKPAPKDDADTATQTTPARPAPQQKEESKPAEPQKRPATHTVAKGDNVYRIARKYYGNDSYAERIIKANNLKDANTITVGSKLILP